MMSAYNADNSEVFKLANYFDTLSILVKTAGYLQINGESEQALRIYQRCRLIAISLFGEQNQFTKEIQLKIANLRVKQNKLIIE